jgi:outer membrane protein assembly factor BamB
VVGTVIGHPLRPEARQRLLALYYGALRVTEPELCDFYLVLEERDAYAQRYAELEGEQERLLAEADRVSAERDLYAQRCVELAGAYERLLAEGDRLLAVRAGADGPLESDHADALRRAQEQLRHAELELDSGRARREELTLLLAERDRQLAEAGEELRKARRALADGERRLLLLFQEREQQQREQQRRLDQEQALAEVDSIVTEALDAMRSEIHHLSPVGSGTGQRDVSAPDTNHSRQGDAAGAKPDPRDQTADTLRTLREYAQREVPRRPAPEPVHAIDRMSPFTVKLLAVVIALLIASVESVVILLVTQPATTPESSARLRWYLKAGDDIWIPPAVAGDTAYVSSDDDKIYAVDTATGKIRWTYATGDKVRSEPAVASGVVYVGSLDGKVYALDAASGKVRWTYTTGNVVTSSPAVASGAVYVGSFDGKVYALDAASGKVRWTYTTGDEVSSNPTVASGVVYIGSNDKKLYALDAVTGIEDWSLPIGTGPSKPAVVEGIVYVGGQENTLYASDAATGKVLWRYTTSNWVSADPVVYAGTVYMGSQDGNVYALNAATGAKEWSYTTLGQVYAGPVESQGSLYLSADHILYCLYATVPQ